MAARFAVACEALGAQGAPTDMLMLEILGHCFLKQDLQSVRIMERLLPARGKPKADPLTLAQSRKACQQRQQCHHAHLQRAFEAGIGLSLLSVTMSLCVTVP